MRTEILQVPTGYKAVLIDKFNKPLLSAIFTSLLDAINHSYKMRLIYRKAA